MTAAWKPVGVAGPLGAQSHAVLVMTVDHGGRSPLGCGVTQNNRTVLRAREPLARASTSESASGLRGSHVRNRLEHS